MNQTHTYRISDLASDYPDWLNHIQHLSVEKHGQIFLTLNPPFPPDPKLKFREFEYHHPVLDANVSIPPRSTLLRKLLLGSLTTLLSTVFCRPPPSNVRSTRSKTPAGFPTQGPGSATASTKMGSRLAYARSRTPSLASACRSIYVTLIESPIRHLRHGRSIG